MKTGIRMKISTYERNGAQREWGSKSATTPINTRGNS
jgi:hypothetical protein